MFIKLYEYKHHNFYMPRVIKEITFIHFLMTKGFQLFNA